MSQTPKKFNRFIRYTSAQETNCHRRCKFLLNSRIHHSMIYYLRRFVLFSVYEYKTAASAMHEYKHKQKETSSRSASLKYSLSPFMSYRDRNCSASNNLCLFAAFPCGSAQWPIIIYAYRALPVSEERPGLPRQCATLTSDHKGI